MLHNIKGIDEIKNIVKVKIGDYAYTRYTKAWYIVSELPNMIEEGYSIFALIRMDGQGHCFKSESLHELVSLLEAERKIGEMEVFRGFVKCE